MGLLAVPILPALPAQCEAWGVASSCCCRVDDWACKHDGGDANAWQAMPAASHCVRVGVQLIWSFTPKLAFTHADSLAVLPALLQPLESPSRDSQPGRTLPKTLSWQLLSIAGLLHSKNIMAWP